MKNVNPVRGLKKSVIYHIVVGVSRLRLTYYFLRHILLNF